MGVQQNGLGLRVLMGVFYEVKVPGVIPKGYARRPQVAVAPLVRGVCTGGRALVAVKLQQGVRNGGQRGGDLGRAL